MTRSRLVAQPTWPLLLFDRSRARGILCVEEQIGNSGWPMVPLYAARIEDLGPGDFGKFESAACSHDALIPPSSLLNGLRLPPTTRVVDLEPRLRCRECDARGKAVVSVRWALNSAFTALLISPGSKSGGRKECL
jgi:hypothetical protein